MTEESQEESGAETAMTAPQMEMSGVYEAISDLDRRLAELETALKIENS